MTRPKVDPSKRQRTASACVPCKKRKQKGFQPCCSFGESAGSLKVDDHKPNGTQALAIQAHYPAVQRWSMGEIARCLVLENICDPRKKDVVIIKCNGLQPCEGCKKRNKSCYYGSIDDHHDGSDEVRSPKRRLVDSPSETDSKSQLPFAKNDQLSSLLDPGNPAGLDQDSYNFPEVHDSNGHLPNGRDASIQGTADTDSIAGTNGNDEEADAPAPRLSMRMLEDPTGRLLYLGDSATLSFLQLIRLTVESVAGRSPFTDDPNRHRIVENTKGLPPNIRHTHLLPDKETANILVQSFMRNTNGLIEVFHHESFIITLDHCYTDPLSVDPSWLCLLHLTFAIGLVMASPVPETRESTIINKLLQEPTDCAEIFYANAKALCDPTTGFEDAGFWSIQALTLMSLYTLTISKRNAAYAYHGMAVRSAFALGLHREETMSCGLFSQDEQAVRRNLWRTLFIMDRFLSTILGRPTSIRESDCSGETLVKGENAFTPFTPFPTVGYPGFRAAPGLDAAVRSCHIIGIVLEKVYSKRKVSTKIAQGIANECSGWQKTLDPSLKPLEENLRDPAQGMATLQVNLLYYHSIVLLTRPFFLFLMTKQYERKENGKLQQKVGERMVPFAKRCVEASCRSIELIQIAFQGQYLPHRNPFILYFLFASALVVLSSEFSNLCTHESGTASMVNALKTMQYCAEHDPQGRRLQFILESFRDVVVQQRTARSAVRAQQSPEKSHSIPPGFVHGLSSNPSISPPHPLPAISRPPPLPTTNGGPVTTLPQEPLSALQAHPTRHNSLDMLLDLSHPSGTSNSGSGSVDGGDSLADAEIDFGDFWHHSSGAAFASSIGMTPGGILSVNPGGLNNMSGAHHGQNTSEPYLPLYGITAPRFPGV